MMSELNEQPAAVDLAKARELAETLARNATHAGHAEAAAMLRSLADEVARQAKEIAELRAELSRFFSTDGVHWLRQAIDQRKEGAG